MKCELLSEDVITVSLKTLGTRTTEWRNEKDRAPPWQHHGCVIGLVMGHPTSNSSSSSIHSQRRIPIDELSAVSQATSSYIDKVTNNISSSPAQKRARYQVSLPDAISPSSSPTRPRSPILIGSRSEGLPTAENDAPLWTGEELTNRRTCFAQHLTTTAG